MPKLVSGRVVKTSISISGRADDGHAELGAVGPADPVALHRLHPLGPVQAVEGIEQLLCVLRDPEEPLGEVAAHDDVARPLAGAVGKDLLVCENGVAARAPVDRGLCPVGEAGAEQLEEDDLVPLHVVGVVAAQLASPVVDRAQSLHRRLELGDARLGVDAGVVAPLDRRVLRRQAERVEAEGGQDGVALHRAMPYEHVTEGVVADVALMGRPARVGVHAQHVVGRPRIVEIDPVGAVLVPAPLPALLDLAKVVCLHATRLVGLRGELRWVRGSERSGRLWSDRVRASLGGVAQLVERLTGSQEVRGFESLRLHPKSWSQQCTAVAESAQRRCECSQKCSHHRRDRSPQREFELDHFRGISAYARRRTTGATVACQYSGRAPWVSSVPARRSQGTSPTRVQSRYRYPEQVGAVWSLQPTLGPCAGLTGLGSLSTAVRAVQSCGQCSSGQEASCEYDGSSRQKSEICAAYE